MLKRIPAPDPRDIISRFRTTYRNYSALADPAESASHLDVESLPEAARRLLETYRSEHPDEHVEVLKHMRVVNSEPGIVVDDGSPLPETRDLLTLSQTVTLATDECVEVVTDVFVASRT